MAKRTEADIRDASYAQAGRDKAVDRPSLGAFLAILATAGLLLVMALGTPPGD